MVYKTVHKFSALATDYAHEQNNVLVKSDGGAVGLTINPGALQRRMVAGPEMSRLPNEFEALYLLIYFIYSLIAVSVNEGQERLPTFCWLLKLHKQPHKARFIANSSSCTTTE